MSLTRRELLKLSPLLALGAFVAGWAVDAFGPHNGFWVSVAACMERSGNARRWRSRRGSTGS